LEILEIYWKLKEPVRFIRVSTTLGNPGNLLEFKRTLLEILEILNLMVLLEIFVYDDRLHWFPDSVVKLGTRSLI